LDLRGPSSKGRMGKRRKREGKGGRKDGRGREGMTCLTTLVTWK